MAALHDHLPSKSFYRYDQCGGSRERIVGSIDALNSSQVFECDRGGHALARIYFASGLLKATECENVLIAAEAAADIQGWSTRRHHRHPTVDFDCSKDPTLLAVCNSLLQNNIIPILSSFFGLARQELEVGSGA